MLNFTNCSKAPSPEDIAELTSLIGREAPSPLLELFSHCNGGTPCKSFLPLRDWEPVEIKKFLPVRLSSTEGPELSINFLLASVRVREFLPLNYLPFAIDHGANYLCLELDEYKIIYWMNDVYDPSKSLELNRRKAERIVADSFPSFLNALVSEDEAFG